LPQIAASPGGLPASRLWSQGHYPRTPLYDDSGACGCGRCNPCHARQGIRSRFRTSEDRRLDEWTKL